MTFKFSKKTFFSSYPVKRKLILQNTIVFESLTWSRYWCDITHMKPKNRQKELNNGNDGNP